MKQVLDMIDDFSGKWECLSNFYMSEFVVNNIRYSSVVHAMQSSKTTDEFYSTTIRNASTPWEAKRLGRIIQIREDWDFIRPSLLKQFVTAKFTDNPLLRGVLLSTGSEELVYKNRSGDTFEGVYKGMGQNRLGICLMQLRDEFVLEEILDQPHYKIAQ